MNKEQTIKKIKKYCKEYDISLPDFDNYESVVKTCNIINSFCVFCKKYNKSNPMSVICPCEISETAPWEDV